MEFGLLWEIVVILGFSVLVVLVFQRFRFPTILGFLLTGVLAGPKALSLVHDYEQVHLLSEIGVILLLFVIGMEFSLRDLVAMRKMVLIGGGIQTGSTIAVVMALLLLLGLRWQEGLFIGFLVSLSSTAIVLRMFQERNQVNSPQGRISLGILIFQDLIVVPMMLLTPIIGGGGGNVGLELLIMLGKTVLVIGAVLLSARYVFPRLMHEIARTRSRELFVLTVVTVCFAVAGLTYAAGLSLALGAFLAGLLMAESDYSHQATGNILPFREVFTSFFFVSIGMLLDAGFLFSHLPLILLLTLLVWALKTTLAALAALALRYPLRTALHTGLSLFQVGEFAFILANTGSEYQLLSETHSQYFLAVSILTMALTPFIMQHSERLAELLAKAPMPAGLRHPQPGLAVPDAAGPHPLKEHVIIVGFGLNGHNVARAARFAQIPYVVLEINADTVKAERERGEPVLYGDATDPFILEHVQVHQARVVVVAISDPAGTRKVVSAIRSICRTVYVIVRTRFVAEIEEILRLGADEVIPEEFETSIEIFTRVLGQYLVPDDTVAEFISQIRAGNYQRLRPAAGPASGAPALTQIPSLRMSVLAVYRDLPELAGKRLAESNLRQRYQVNLVAIQRREAMLTDIGPDTELMQEDLLYVIGSPAAIGEFSKALNH
ncbi:MAG: cation:proton antiporter [Bacteroidia bacterium]|nr:cation:proton antiporter [Bacteroidia bacterium]